MVLGLKDIISANIRAVKSMNLDPNKGWRPGGAMGNMPALQPDQQYLVAVAVDGINGWIHELHVVSVDPETEFQLRHSCGSPALFEWTNVDWYKPVREIKPPTDSLPS